MTRLNARIDDELAEKLRRIREATNMSTTDIVRSALEAFYVRFEAERPKDPKSVLEASGFVGCASGDETLSSRYKELLDASFETKT